VRTPPRFRSALRGVLTLALLASTLVARGVVTDDTEPPVLSCPTLVQAFAPAGTCETTVSYTVTATDNGDGEVQIECTPPSGSVFRAGHTRVQCRAWDEAGNEAACEFTVRVALSSPGTVFCPANLTVPSEPDRWGATVTFPLPTSDSPCLPVEIIATPPSGSFFPVGETTVQVVARDSAGIVETCSFKVTVTSPLNIVWPTAQLIPLTRNTENVLVGHVEQALTSLDESRWFKVQVQPGARFVVTLTSLPANYDLVLFRDIAAAYREELEPSDLPLLDAEFADDAFAPAQFSPAQFSPAQFSPAAFSPAQFSPAQFSPAQFSPAQFSPAQFSPAQFSVDAFAPAQFSVDAFAPAQFSPAQFSPAQFSPAQFSPAQFSEAAYASAQVRSAIGISAFDGLLNEGILVNTWNENTEFYIRVRGRQGVFDPADTFRLDVALFPGLCDQIESVPTDGSGNPIPDPGTAAPAGGFHTLILADLDRLYAGSPASRQPLLDALTTLAARPEVRGHVLDVGSDAWVRFFNQQADSRKECAFAKNLVAERIRTLVNRSRAGNDLQYLVILGNDGVIPFFRQPDQAMLGPEMDYVPPVFEFSASQASLRGNFFLTQDRYGSDTEVVRTELRLPLPDLALGRLVETPEEIIGMIQAYLETDGGLLPTPATALVTGYDFLEDAAQAVAAEWTAGAGISPERLITPPDIAPSDPASWSASDLASLLLTRRHDVLFLAGHFNTAGTLAADFTTRLLAHELLRPELDLKNAFFYSPGCHSGYNLVDTDAIPQITLQPDWAQVAARKRMILLAGTGYQYGDTDFLEYSERLYRDFTRQLRRGTGPVTLGQALVRAKQQYLADVTDLRGIHEKALLQATLFGLPMAAYNLPGRIPDSTTGSIVPATLAYPQDPPSPGRELGLEYADVEVLANLTRKTLLLKNAQYDPADPNDRPEFEAVWYEGGDGILVNPAEPVLPLEMRDVSVANRHLRGIGFRGGSYLEETDVTPLTGAATTEIRGVHPAFLSPEFFPSKFWKPNYFSQLFEEVAGGTRLVVTPAQVRTGVAGNTGVIRRFPSSKYRLFYSSNTQTYQEGDLPPSTPALSGPPTIARVDATVENARVRFAIQVIGNPAAGIQEVWVLYTAKSGPLHGRWSVLDLRQSDNFIVWVGELDLGSTPPEDVRFTVQAVNGIGLVAFASNLGAGYIPGQTDPSGGEQTATALELLSPPASATYGSQLNLQARLTSNANPVPDQLVRFKLGGLESRALTDASGVARVRLNLLLPPGILQLAAAFDGTATLAPSSSETPFTLQKAPARLDLAPVNAVVAPNADSTIEAVLVAPGQTPASDQPLLEQPVVFVVRGSQSEFVTVVNTDYLGRAPLGVVPLPQGTYSVQAFFGQTVPVPPDNTLVGSPNSRYLAATSPLGTLTLDGRVPTANEDRIPSRAGAALKIAIASLLANDTDPDDDTLVLDRADATTGRGIPIVRNGAWLLMENTAPVTDAFEYTLNDGTGRTATARVVIEPQSDEEATSNILGFRIEDGRVFLRFAGIPARRYRIEFSPSMSPPAWQPLGSAVIRNDGTAEFSAPLPGDSGFYRTAYP